MFKHPDVIFTHFFLRSPVDLSYKLILYKEINKLLNYDMNLQVCHPTKVLHTTVLRGLAYYSSMQWMTHNFVLEAFE
jgi:hypothetical protein